MLWGLHTQSNKRDFHTYIIYGHPHTVFLFLSSFPPFGGLSGSLCFIILSYGIWVTNQFLPIHPLSCLRDHLVYPLTRNGAALLLGLLTNWPIMGVMDAALSCFPQSNLHVRSEVSPLLNPGLRGVPSCSY